MYRVLVVDHHPLVLSALSDIVAEASGLELAGIASSVPEAIDRALQLNPDIVLMDMDMPGGGGERLAETLSGLIPQARIVPLSALSIPTFSANPLAKTLIAPNMLKELY